MLTNVPVFANTLPPYANHYIGHHTHEDSTRTTLRKQHQARCHLVEAPRLQTTCAL